MNEDVYVRRHPSEDDVLVLDVPRELNHAMGSFQPATLLRNVRVASGFTCYSIQAEAWESFQRFCHYRGWSITDGRAPHAPFHRLEKIECGNIIAEVIDPSNGRKIGYEYCCQPAVVTNPPDYCPSCGQAFRPRTVSEVVGLEALTGTRACPNCGVLNRGGFAFCARCSSPLPGPAAERRPGVALLPRERLADPLPIAAPIRDLPALPAASAARHDEPYCGRAVTHPRHEIWADTWCSGQPPPDDNEGLRWDQR